VPDSLVFITGRPVRSTRSDEPSAARQGGRRPHHRLRPTRWGVPARLLDTEKRADAAKTRRPDWAMLVGVAASTGPCISALAHLVMAGGKGRSPRSDSSHRLFSRLRIPFLLTSLAVNRFFSKRAIQALPRDQVTSGVLRSRSAFSSSRTSSRCRPLS
jgi:hypothetical protein